jgi:hypothetical protein
VPTLKVIFGLHLDGQRAVAPTHRLGEVAVGPLGFLDLLETRLGLLAEYPSHAERIVQQRECLMRADSPARFYHASFATDALGTASTLLAWRDLWNLHGWNGRIPAGASQRLRDLADVEVLARNTVAFSVGERLARVRIELDKRQPAIGEVRLVDPIEVFPRRWQAVLARLPVVASRLEGTGEGFLGDLQKTLQQALAGEAFARIDWQEDGSVTVVQAETRFLAASWLASRIDESTPTLLVVGAEGACLDDHLVALGRPRQGMGEASAFRPALQVLPLALEILWKPLNFHGLVQFLTHPVCPLPGHARRRLAAKMAEAPGIGGRTWEKALADIDRYYGDEAPGVREKIRQWVEPPRFSPSDGAPCAIVLARVRQLVAFFQARLGEADRAKRLSFIAGHAQCRACAESLAALQAQGVAFIPPRQLQRLVAQATADGTANPLLAAEVGARLTIMHPGAAVQSSEQVIWWQLVMPVLPASYPWSAAELRSLAEAEVLLPGSEARLAQAGREWLRPLLAARKHLTLVLPAPGEELHPVWQMIQAVVDSPVVGVLERLLTDGSEATRRVICTPLPVAKRWWHLPEEVKVRLRPEESFSSLELLLFNPYQWLLKYPAALRPSRLVSLGGDFRMFGNLAHGLVERYYQRPDALTLAETPFNAWFDPAFDQLIEEEGAFLLIAGRGADLQDFRHRLRHAMRILRQQMTRAGAVRVAPECAVAGQFPGGRLSGLADLVMHKDNEEYALIDMKWSGEKKFPEKLSRNRHLQLAIYAELLRQKKGAWPSVAYYVLDQARLFSPDDRAFPDAEVVPSALGENTAQLWQRFIESWKWRQVQIDAGLFEVGLERIGETEDSVPPAGAMVPEYLDESWNEYRALAGWEQ